jgi:hypothetical protein
MRGILRHRDNTPPVIGGYIQIGNGTSLQYNRPNNWGENYSKTAYIWTAAELGAAKTITGISLFHRQYSTPASQGNQTIKLAHVAQSVFDSTPAINFSDMTLSNLTTVKNTFTYSISNNNVWLQTNFTTNFVYDGVSNLILIWEHNDNDWDSTAGGADGLSVTAKGMTAASSAPLNQAANGSLLNTRPNIRFHY